MIQLSPMLDRLPTLDLCPAIGSLQSFADGLIGHRALLAADGLRTTFEFARIQSNADWIAPIIAFVLVGLYVRYMYRRDAAELPRPLGWFLTGLRTAAFLGLLIFYLQPQWRTEQRLTANSRVLLLADTSLSMGLSDQEQANTTPRTPAARWEQVAQGLRESRMLDALRQTHDVQLYRFDEKLYRDARVSLPKADADDNSEQEPGEPSRSQRGADQAEGPAGQRDAGEQPPPADPADEDGAIASDREDDEYHTDLSRQIADLLRPQGTETRLGQALAQLLHEERAAPLSGVLLFSDGGQNTGVGPRQAVEAAKRAQVPVFTVGLGSDRLPANVRLSDLLAPERAFPGDRYSVTALVQARQLAGRVVTLELRSRRADDRAAEPGDGVLLERREVTLGSDGEVLPVKFEVNPDEQSSGNDNAGRRILSVRVQAPADDRNPADNLREAEVEIVDRQTRVLLWAGGPTREYRFLRNMLYRDSTVTVDVLLQTASGDVSQESDKMLEDFPNTREAMYAYDCIVAFDPDIAQLTTGQVELMETWVAEQGGGLIFVAGPVNAGRSVSGWVRDPAYDKMRALLPVEFQRRFSTIDAAATGSREPWPLEFTREGFEAEFLWLGESEPESRLTWQEFPGVYGYLPVRGAKGGATVLAWFSDPEAAAGGDRPPYMAWHFYASGRVFYLGSGEMWRLRALDDKHFEQLYTKLIRHVSKGRLLRGSTRGVLLVGRERYLLGNTVDIQAYRLTDARLDPLDVPEVELNAIGPGGRTQSVALRADATRVGSYVGQFTALEEGDYRLELPLPESDAPLTRRIQVRMPQLENENPQRNDALLSQIATATGGRYYPEIRQALQLDGPGALPALLEDRTRTSFTPVAANREWEQQWLTVLMYTLCGLLCLEWLLRRLFRLA